MPIASVKSGRLGVGCAVLFSLPFIAAGFGTSIWSASLALKHTAMQSWVEVPATIKRAEFKRVRGDENDTFQVVAEYDYEFDGRGFKGERVGIHSGSDNVGDFQQKSFQVLKQHHDARKPFRCFVNPRAPSESILFRDLRWELMAFNSIFPATFGSMGLGMLTGVLVAARRAPKNAAADVPADEPWKSRADWAAGRILAGGASVAVPILAAITLWWWIATAPFLIKLPGMLRATESPWRWLTLAFPLVGTVLFAALVHQYFRWRKFGESVLQLAATPGVVGGQLAGVVQISRVVQAEGGFRMKLSCMHRTAKARQNEMQEEVLWQDERIVTEPMRDIAGGATALPVLFAIPFDTPETSRAASSRDVRWQLDVSAKVPGVNYYATFEVPVFKTAESRADFKLDESLIADYSTAPPRDLVLRQAGIVRQPLPGGGVRLVFPAARNLSSALGGTIFLAIWSGAMWLMLRVGAPILFPIVFGLVELIAIWVVVELWLYRSVVEADNRGLTFRGGLFGIGRKRFWAAEEVKRFTTRESMSSGNNLWKNIVVATTNGKERVIAQSINGKLAQEAVIDELNAALGRVHKT